MQRIYVFVFCSVVGLLSAVHVLPAHAEFTPRVVVSEINWGGSSRGIADEWLELANLDAQPADISGWTVSGVATGGGDLTFAEGTTIPARGTYLVANYAPGESSTLADEPAFITTAVSIPNTKLTVALAMPDGTVVDALSDPGTPDFGSSIAPFASMERDLVSLAWSSATASLGFTDETQFGTPGYTNVPLTAEEVPVEEPIAEEPVVEEVVIEDIIADEPIVEDVITPEPDAEKPIIAETEFVLDVMLEAAPVVEDAIVETPVVEAAPEVTAEVTPSAEIVETIVIEEEPAASAPPVETTIVPTEESGDLAAAVTETLADAATEEPIVETVAAATTPTTGMLQLNEIVADGNEWIEVRNADTHDIDVNLWVVRDTSGKETSLGAFVLAPDALLVIDAPKGKLNNDGDVVELVDGTGTVIDRVEYGTDTLAAPDSDESLVRTADGWFVLTTITKGETNPILMAAVEEVTKEVVETVTESTSAAASTATEVPPATVASTYVPPSHAPAPVVTASAPDAPPSTTTTTAPTTKKSTTRTKAASTTTKKTASASVKKASHAKKSAVVVTDIRDVADGALVRYTGTVIALPGTFGSQVMFLDGAAVYFYHAEWPTLALGDVVTVEGEVSTARGERRIKVANADAITLTGHVDIAAIEVTTLDNATSAHLVRIDGTISAREGDVLTVTVGSTTIRVVASTQSGIRWSSLTGNHVVITGVVRHMDGEFTLMPRSVDDVVVEHDETIAPARTTSHFPTRSVLGGGVLTSTAGMLGYWFVRSRTLIPNL